MELKIYNPQEDGSQIPGQLSLDLPEPEPEPEPVRGYDPSTGEIYETEDKVINLREAK